MTPLAVATLDLCAIPGIGPGACVVGDALTSPEAVIGGLVGGPPGLIGGAASTLGMAMLGQIADAFFNSWWLFQATTLTFWTNSPTPGPADLLAPVSAQRWVAWLAQFVLIISILIAAGRTILTRDGRNLADAGRAVVLTILTSALAVTVAAALVAAGDAIANALLGGSLAQGFGADPAPLGAALLAAGGPLALLVSTVGFLTSIVQFFILLARNAVLPVVIVLLPLAAAAGGAQIGRAWFGRLAAWLLALAFYKPVAALIYAVVLTQARTADSLVKALTALVGMAAAIITLPALIKLFSPSPAGGGGGGGGYASGMAASAVLSKVSARG
jgi:hypothetical protein